jgi:putative ABC transport system permease protein
MRWNLILRIAFRNQRRHLRRTLLTLSSVAFGLAIILWIQCVLNSRTDELVDTVTSVQTGHLQLLSEEYLRDRLPQYAFKPEPALTAALPPGSTVSPRARWGAIVSSGENSVPVMLEGVEPGTERAITRVHERVTAGSWLEPEADPDCPSRQILIGSALADLLGVKPGEKVVVMGPAVDGTLGNDLFRVQGVFDTGSREFDRAVAYAPLACLRKVSAIAGVHELAVRLPDRRALDGALAAIRPGLPAGLKAVSWLEVQPRFAMVIKYNDATVAFFAVFLFVVIAFGIMNTLFVSIFERTREFGLMIALGTPPGLVNRIVWTEALLLGLAASVVGTALGSLAVLYHSRAGLDLRPFLGESAMFGQFQLGLTVYPRLELGPFLKQLLGMNAVIFAASLLPALRAGRLDPVETLRST